MLLVSGLHPAGIDEPRLTHLARTLAESNVLVVTPDFAELSRFDITPRVTNRNRSSRGVAGAGIGLCAGWTHRVDRRQLQGRIGEDYFCASGDPSDETGPPERRLTPGAPHDDGVATAVLDLGYVPTRSVDEKPNSE